MQRKPTPEDIDAHLPQTQCGECGYTDCLSYAKAITQEETQINHCLPGGVSTLMKLAHILNCDVTSFIEDMQTRTPMVATIREDECIGCTKCIQACPVDAILGSTKQMHTVIRHECTGCNLCVAPCPVDCIDMQTVDEPLYNPEIARKRYVHHQQRVQHTQKKQQQLKQPHDSNTEKQAYIREAIARVKIKRIQLEKHANTK